MIHDLSYYMLTSHLQELAPKLVTTLRPLWVEVLQG